MSTKLFPAAIAVLSLVCIAPSLSAQTGMPETQPVLLQMIRDDSIHEELKLSDQQIAEVLKAIEPIDGPWFRVRIRPANERIATIAELTNQLQAKLAGILQTGQMTRLNQLHNQALGTRMIVRDETARELGISDETRSQLYEIFVDTDKRVAEIQSKVQKGETDGLEGGKEVKKIQTAERTKFIDSLSNDQRRKLSSLTGSTFNFAGVKRMYPSAPELSMQGSQWLQGSDMSLEELRGKVVAVHFYAFQCINCRRNLPHYNGWHKDYADKGLVVIGIQTPETSAEEQPDRVSAAIRNEQIEYPVLMDGDKSNWTQWSNTMWPTVYLIDKKGFLRRWWQGEMNWKGTPGEKQMRETIESLLAEDA